MDISQLENALQAVYGRQEGPAVCRRILPGLLADFRKMLLSARPGAIVTEDYRLEDGKATITLKAVKKIGAGMTPAAGGPGMDDLCSGIEIRVS